MDAYLSSLGLWRKPVAKDGSCLFRTVAEQLFLTQANHLGVRRACVQYLYTHRQLFEPFIDGSFDHHLYILQFPKEWAGQVEIAALSQLYKRDFIIYQSIGNLPNNVTQNGFSKKVVLCFTDGNHYDSVYPKYVMQHSALAQSVVYELLYREVFKLDWELAESVNFIRQQSRSKRRKDSTGSNSDKPDSEIMDNGCPDCNINSCRDKDVCSRSPGLVLRDIHRMYLGRPADCVLGFLYASALDDRQVCSDRVSPPLPYRIAKALDPEIYRNVELDIWQEAKKIFIQKDYQSNRGVQFAPGDKCQVVFDEGHVEKHYNAHIQEIGSEKGPVIVFIEELGQKHEVPFKSLRPLPLPQIQSDASFSGWNFLSKSYKQLSGYYQKVGASDSEYYSAKKKSFRRKKDMPVVIHMGNNPRMPIPPDGIGRGKRWPGNRNSKVFDQAIGGGFQKIDSAGRPLRPKHWQQDGPRNSLPVMPNPANIMDDGFPPLTTTMNRPMTMNGPNCWKMNMCPPPCEPHLLEQPAMPVPADVSPMLQKASPGATGQSPASPMTTGMPPPILQGAPPIPMQPGSVIMQPVPHVPINPCIWIPYLENMNTSINTNCARSQDPGGTDLPLTDVNTLRFYFNLGLEYHRAISYLQLPPQQSPIHSLVNSLTNIPNGSYAAVSGEIVCDQPDLRMTHGIASMPSDDRTCASNNSGSHNDHCGIVSACSIETASNPQCDGDAAKKVELVKELESSADSGCGSDYGNGSPIHSTREGNMTATSLISTDSTEQESRSTVEDQNEVAPNDLQQVFSELDLEDVDERSTNNVKLVKTKRKYYRYGNLKLVKPIKDIPPRFQHMLAESSAEKARCEGRPIVIQYPPSAEFNVSNAAEVCPRDLSFNPEAQCFLPGYSALSTNDDNNCAADQSEVLHAAQPMSDVGPVSDDLPSNASAAPVYTIHVYGTPPPPPSTAGGVLGNSPTSPCCMHRSSLCTGYGAPDGSHCQGTVYYNPPYAATQSCLPYQPQQPVNAGGGGQVSYGLCTTYTPSAQYVTPPQ